MTSKRQAGVGWAGLGEKGLNAAGLELVQSLHEAGFPSFLGNQLRLCRLFDLLHLPDVLHRFPEDGDLWSSLVVL